VPLIVSVEPAPIERHSVPNQLLQNVTQCRTSSYRMSLNAEPAPTECHSVPNQLLQNVTKCRTSSYRMSLSAGPAPTECHSVPNQLHRMPHTANCGTSSHRVLLTLCEEPRFTEHECIRSKNKGLGDEFSIMPLTILIVFRYLMEIILLNKTEWVVPSGK
jgi:hypothetical protein